MAWYGSHINAAACRYVLYGALVGTCSLYEIIIITSDDENHLCGVSLCENHKISLKAQWHGATVVPQTIIADQSVVTLD